MTPRTAVAIGGGTGLPLVLGCMRRAGFETSAVVTVADDGGSSGHLRRELGILPPGDIRNCLVALAEPGNELARVFQYRFAEGDGLAGHALGNLIIAALTDLEGGFAEAVEEAGKLLRVRGRVLPSTLEDVVLSARDATGTLITGQANVAGSEGPVRTVCIEPERPVAYPPAIEALLAADVIVLGPGSLFTSITPNLLVEGIADAIARSGATVIYVCNVANQRSETKGMDAADHLEALLPHGLDGVVSVAIIDGSDPVEGVPHVAGGEAVTARIESHGVRVVSATLADPKDPVRHDPEALYTALSGVW